MGNNLIHNYLNNPRNFAQAQTPSRANEKGYFGMPSVSSTMDSFDTETDKLIKPLDGKGYLVNENPLLMPKETIRDTVYTTKALVDGVRGKANDHQLGKLNDLGLKMSGVAIATYLMTRKTTPKTKAMEFIGFGAFLASMALWPKIALEIPARLIHGFNFRKQYVDEQGRKKFVTQDPNYIPFDLYKGNKKSEDLDVIGDRLGIKRDIPNRHEAVKEQMRKISVQNNTLWMLTAGVATPLMTALACNQAEKVLTPALEKMSNKKANANIDKIDAYLNGSMNALDSAKYEADVLKIARADGKKVATPVETMLAGMKGRIVSSEEIGKLADTLANGFDSEMKDAAKSDIVGIIGDSRYIANNSSAETLTQSIHSAISGVDSNLAKKVTPEKLKGAISEGIVRGAVRDLLTEVGFEVIDADSKYSGSQVSTNFKCREVNNIDFFRVTEETKNMSPVDRLAHNIKSTIMKVNNSNPSEDFVPGMSDLERNNRELKSKIDARLSAKADEIAHQFYEGNLAVGNGRENYVRQAVGKVYKSEAPRGPKFDKLFGTISEIVSKESANNRGFVISERASEAIAKTSKAVAKYSAIDEVVSSAAHFKVEKANETLVANNWDEVSKLFVEELGLSSKDLTHASKDRNASKQIFAQKLEAVCSDDRAYKEFIEKLARKMVQLDEKMDTPNANSSGRMMNKIESGIVKNCEEAGNAFGECGMSEMKKKMLGTKKGDLGINVGSIMNSKIERLHSRIDGVHSSYMRLLETAEFFNRAHGYKEAVQAANGVVTPEIAKKFGFTQNSEVNEQIIEQGKKLLTDAHTSKFYNKMGLHNNKDFFKTLMWSVYRPITDWKGTWNEGWSESTEDTIRILDDIKVQHGEELEAPRRVFDGAENKSLGQKLKEHMNQVYNSMGSIERKIVGGAERVKADGGVSISDQRACKRFDLLGKATSDFFHDTVKQMYNSNKWMKTFAPILAGTFALTVAAQFFFGKKDDDIKA